MDKTALRYIKDANDGMELIDYLDKVKDMIGYF